MYERDKRSPDDATHVFKNRKLKKKNLKEIIRNLRPKKKKMESQVPRELRVPKRRE